MATPFLGLRTSIYRVNNLAEATAWYSKAFGIEPYFNQPYYVGFNVAGYELGLLPEEGKSMRGENVEVYWGVEDAEAAFAQMLAAGATAHQQPTDVGEGIVVATVKDPWGNILGIIKNPHFKL